MVALAILFLQLVCGISNPTSDQISKVTVDQQQSVATYSSTTTSTGTTTYNSTPYDIAVID